MEHPKPRKGGATLNDQLIASYIALAIKGIDKRIWDDESIDVPETMLQQCGVRRAAAAIADTLGAFGIDPVEFLKEAGYGA